MLQLTEKRPTLSEIARLSSCSKAAVSTILNQSRSTTMVSDGLRKQVEAVAKDLGYVPRFASRSLATGKSQTLGIYIPANPWAGVGGGYERLILAGIEKACQAAGYDMLMINLNGERSLEDCLYKVAEARVDGVVVIHVTGESGLLERLVASCRNIVAVDYSHAEPAELDAVVFDNAAAMELAVEHLVGLGHRRIGYVGGGKAPIVTDDRLRRDGFLAAMRKRGLEVDPGWVMMDLPAGLDEEIPGGRLRLLANRAVDRTIELGDRGPTSVVAFSDLVAAAIVQRCAARGVSVPGRLSVVGVDDSPLCEWINPPLTSIGHPLSKMGETAARMLIDRAAQPSSQDNGVARKKGQRITFSPVLAARQTTGRVIESIKGDPS